MTPLTPGDWIQIAAVLVGGGSLKWFYRRLKLLNELTENGGKSLKDKVNELVKVTVEQNEILAGQNQVLDSHTSQLGDLTKKIELRNRLKRANGNRKKISR